MLRIRIVLGVPTLLLLIFATISPMHAEDEYCNIVGMQVMCKVPEQKVLVGDPFTASARVTNTGTVPMSNVSLALRGGSGVRVVGNAADLTAVVERLEPGATHEVHGIFTSDGVGERRIDASAREDRGWASAGCYCGVLVEGLPALQLEMIDLNIQRRKEGVFEEGESFLYVLKVLNDMGTAITPDLKVVWALPPELTFVSGSGDRGVTVTGRGTTAESSSFVLAPAQEQRFDLVVKAVAVPPQHLVQARASVQTTAGAELIAETESTTLRPPAGR